MTNFHSKTNDSKLGSNFLKPPPTPTEAEATEDIDRTGDKVFACTTEVVRTVIQLNRESNFADSSSLVVLIKVSARLDLVIYAFG